MRPEKGDPRGHKVTDQQCGLENVPEKGTGLATGCKIQLHTELQAQCVSGMPGLTMAACDPFRSLRTPETVTACRGLSVLFQGSWHPSSLQPMLALLYVSLYTTQGAVCVRAQSWDVLESTIPNVSTGPSILLGSG